MACPHPNTLTRDKKLIVGNWKMNGLRSDSRDRVAEMVKALSADVGVRYGAVLCPPTALLVPVRQNIDDMYLCGEAVIALGAQDCHAQAYGAFTGDTSPRLLADVGCSFVIVGHSERRQLHAETSSIVRDKAAAALLCGLTPIICFGETEAERVAGKHFDVVAEQIAKSLPDTATAENAVLAYEPVWAIGTGKTATADDVRQMHAHIRQKLGNNMRILYGGSVKPSNAAEILHTENVDGVLVGGASLVAADFIAIAQAS